MQLVDELKQQLQNEQSYFRRHLVQEDITRLEKLAALIPEHPDAAAFVAAGQKLGWTPDDRRTHELKPALEPLLHALYEQWVSAPVAAPDQFDARIVLLWRTFEDLRMDRLVGCLSRVPRPQDGAGA